MTDDLGGEAMSVITRGAAHQWSMQH